MATPQTTPDGSDAHTTLSERDSKALLADYGIPIAAERVVEDATAAGAAADEVGYPVVAKLNGDAIAHKGEDLMAGLPGRAAAGGGLGHD